MSDLLLHSSDFLFSKRQRRNLIRTAIKPVRFLTFKTKPNLKSNWSNRFDFTLFFCYQLPKPDCQSPRLWFFSALYKILIGGFDESSRLHIRNNSLYFSTSTNLFRSTWFQHLLGYYFCFTIYVYVKKKYLIRWIYIRLEDKC